MIELDLAERERNTMTTDDAQRVLQDIVITFRTRLCHLPSYLADHDRIASSGLRDAQAEALIDKEIRAACEELSNPDRQLYWQEDEAPPPWAVEFHRYIKNYPPPKGLIHENIIRACIATEIPTETPITPESGEPAIEKEPGS
jgi:hypothetical protein